MATPFSDVYDSFLTKIDDPTLLSMAQDDLEDTMYNWLIFAITMFPKCKNNLQDMDMTNYQFNADLDIFEKEILATWMKYDYLDKFVFRRYQLAQAMSSKDYALYSQAQHLAQLLNLKEQTYREANKKMTDYLYNNLDYGTLS